MAISPTFILYLAIFCGIGFTVAFFVLVNKACAERDNIRKQEELRKKKLAAHRGADRLLYSIYNK